MGLRVTEEAELEGLDKAYHREMAYFQDGLGTAAAVEDSPEEVANTTKN